MREHLGKWVRILQGLLHMETDTEGLITKQQLAPRLELTVRGVDCLRKSGKIPWLQISPKCVRFDWAKVKAALSAFEVKAVKK
jgi:hypothetical protein